MSYQPDEGLFLSNAAAATLNEPMPRLTWVLYLLAGVLTAAIVWASLAMVDQVTRIDGRVVPEGKEQVIASLESGILREVLVHEGEKVRKGQELARLDPTRVESQQNEGQLRRWSLEASAARLKAEANGSALVFPSELTKEHVRLVEAETAAYEARKRVLDEAVEATNRSTGLLRRELKMAQNMSAKGLMSDVEVMRLTRQVNELEQSRNERISRFRQDASGELVRVQNELALIDEQMVVREDAIDRTVLRSPVDGWVKNIRANTVGGVIGSGAPIMEIVPASERVLIETRIKPADVGFLHVGNKAIVKLAGYDYNIYGGLKGAIEYISPDALGEVDAKGADARYYRALVRADENNLHYKGEPVPVIPGMGAVVEIRTGERSVLSFILRPMMKSREAMSER